MALMFSGGPGVADAMISLGIKPEYAMGNWLGPWTNQAQIDGHIAYCKARGVKPAFQFFYWGDELCLEAIKGTVQPRELGTGVVQSLGAYWALAKLLTDRLKATGTTTALISIESEWNKLGQKAPAGTHSIMSEPAVFDKFFADSASLFHTAPGTKVVTCPGRWGISLADQLAKFPLMVAATDFVGTQGLHTLKDMTQAAYVAGADSFLGRVQQLKVGGKGKPIYIMDTAWSTYGGSYEPAKPWAPIHPATIDSNLRFGEDLQRRALERFVSLLPQLEAAGLRGIFYRGLKDSQMALGNYYGYFEWGWGVVRRDGTKKPAYNALMAMAQNAAPEPAPAPTPPPDPKTRTEAEFTAVVAARDKAVQEAASLREERDRLQGRLERTAPHLEAAKAALAGV